MANAHTVHAHPAHMMNGAHGPKHSLTCVTTLCADVCACVLQAVQLVPALPTRLLPMLVQNMPHKLRDRSAQCLYLGALISLSEGKVGPALREGLLGGLVEHLLSIDADIRWEDIVDAPTGGRFVVSS